jgi:cyclopropane fatty-acyl-phospholipid synthase-like methyltransferase
MPQFSTLAFTTQTMFEIINIVKEKDILEFEVLNPDLFTSHYAGTVVEIENQKYLYRGYKTWMDLAQIFQCRMLTPQPKSSHTVLIRFEKLNTEDSFHASLDTKQEKYGTESLFAQIHKNEEPAFLAHYLKALENVTINKRLRILNLGVNSGDEFEIIKEYATNFQNMELVGIDYSPSAIHLAKEKFSACGNISFYTHDINELDSLQLGEFDLIISIGTLQSSNLEFYPLFMSLVQNYLKKEGAVVLGFPNCRWIDGEMVYGAKAKNYSFSEMSLLYKDVVFCKKYLQQKKFRVTVTGKEYIFLTATSIRK